MVSVQIPVTLMYSPHTSDVQYASLYYNIPLQIIVERIKSLLDSLLQGSFAHTSPALPSHYQLYHLTYPNEVRFTVCLSMLVDLYGIIV